MPGTWVAAGVLLVVALAHAFLNGMHDSANVVATLVSSWAMSVRQALFVTAVCEFVGPFLFGLSVATTIGNRVVPTDKVTLAVVLAALLAAIAWNGITLRLGVPSSSSHALVGGLVGATVAGYGASAIQAGGLLTVLAALLVSPLLGLLLGFVAMRVQLFMLRGASSRITVWLRRSQWVTAGAVAVAHGANAAQKSMGVIALGLVAAHVLPAFRVPFWVVVASAVAVALGTYTGGSRVIRTVGLKFFKIRPMHALASQVVSAGIIIVVNLLGGPVSTTQVMSASILGAGSGHRISQVHWGVARDILLAWVLTFPITALLAAGLYVPLSLIRWP